MTCPAPTPVYLGEPPCLAWWHGTGRPAELAVLLCPTWGDEELGAYRPLRDLAQDLARAGVPVLRLDLPGEGDAFELPDPHSDRLAAWMASLQAALASLRAWSGAPRHVLLGLRLGALLAARLAEEEQAAGRDDVVGVMALLPPVSGRAWLREQRLLGAGQRPAVPLDDGLVVGGFVLNAASAASLQALRWPDPREAVVPACLWLPRDALAGPGTTLAWARQTDAPAWPGLDKLLAIAHQAAWPKGVRAQLLRWVLAQAATRVASDGRSSPASPPPVFEAAVASQGTIEERTVVLPGRPQRVAVVSQATTTVAGVAGRAAVLFLSSGAERRIGPHRLWVAQARARAEAGDVVMRLDLCGIGDSDDHPEPADGPMYDPRAVEDVRAAVHWLREVAQANSVTVVGLCSGAFHAWRSALAGVDVQQLVCVNPLVFHWHAGMDPNPLQQRFVQEAVSAQALASLGDRQRWRRLLAGQVRVGLIARALAGRAVAWLGDSWRDLARGLGQPLRDDLGAELQQVARRGVRLHFVFAQNDPGGAVLRGQGGRALDALRRTGQVRVHQIAGADHTFAGQEGRHELHRLLSRLCVAPVLDPVAVSASSGAVASSLAESPRSLRS